VAEQHVRATSFGAIAEDYDRFRPGPATEVIDWLLPADARTVVDLGAGTGALTRLLVPRVPQVLSVEPDDRMRQVLIDNNPGAVALSGRGDAMPLDDAIADAVLVSSAWHWMDVEPTLGEIARVLRLGGTLGVVWAGPNRRVPWFRQWVGRARDSSGVATGIADALPESETAAEAGNARNAERHRHNFALPAGAPFTEPEFAEILWSTTMTIDDLVGLAGTYSTVITLPPGSREEVLRAARTWLVAQPELADPETGGIEVPFLAMCWRTTRAV